MIKLTKDHPTFQRLKQQVDEAVKQQSTLIARQLVSETLSPIAAAPLIKKGMKALENRLYRHYGLTGKYVGH